MLPGQKPEQMLIQRILAPNFGTAIKVKKTLSLMNLEEESTLVTCSDGWIVTRAWWRSKEAQNAYKLNAYGLPRICTPITGTKDWTMLQDLPFLED